MQIRPHAHPTEVALVIIAAVGVALEMWAIIVASRHRALFRSGLHGFVALISLIDEWLRGVTQLLVMCAGLFLTFSPPPPPGLTPEAVTSRIFFIAVSVLLVVKSGVNQWARRHVKRLDSQRYGRRSNDG